MKKYELYRKEGNLWRIKALEDFGYIKKGDLGGLIEKEKNLSQEGNCWVYGNAIVCDNAIVRDNAIVCNDAVVCDNTKVYGDAHVYGNARVENNAEVYGNARVYGNVKVIYNAKVCGDVMADSGLLICGDIADSPTPIAEEGVKYDEGKNRLDLINPKVLWQIGECLTYGAKKYSADNWKKLENLERRYYEAAFRHMLQWRTGEELDPESGLPHLIHAITSLHFILAKKYDKGE